MAQLKITKKDLSIDDLRFLAMMKSTFDSFIKEVNLSDFPISILEEAGDLESFYYEVNGVKATAVPGADNAI